MKTFDELCLMTEEELLQYQKEETEAIIQSAPPPQQLKLRAFVARLHIKNNTIKNPYYRAEKYYGDMLVGLQTLNDMLLSFRGDIHGHKNQSCKGG